MILQKKNIVPIVLVFCIVLVILVALTTSIFRVEKKHSSNIPVELNKKIVISPECDKIIFSSNENNYFNPTIIDSIFTNGFAVLTEVKGLENKNYYPQSISCDCNLVSLAYENLETPGFNAGIYDFKQKRILPYPDLEKPDINNPLFSPVDSTFAFLSSGNLFLFDYHKKLEKKIPRLDSVFFKYFSWSGKGKYLFLQDSDSRIWSYNLEDNHFDLIWKGINYFNTSRLITPSHEDDDEFYFIADEDSDFNQIYIYNKKKGARVLINSGYDKFLLEQPVYNQQLYFKSNENGEFLIKKYHNERIDNITETGVAYNFFPINKKLNLLLYADNVTPASLFLLKENEKEDILKINHLKSAYVPVYFYNELGMFHLIYLPKIKKKGWVVWLHGGPYEQVSARFNPYITSLVDNGYIVVALNYPGSTGLGNKYEVIDNTDAIKFQIKAIHKDINLIKNKFRFDGSFIMVGVSYGSLLAHRYTNTHDKEVSKLIDFSGLSSLAIKKDIPKLYIYGNKDYSLNNQMRISMLQKESTNENFDELILEGEGHFISTRMNMGRIIAKLKSFLNQN